MKKRRKTKTKYSSVSLPSPLIEKIKKTIEKTSYVSVSDFVTDVLRTILSVKKLKKKGKIFGKEEEEATKERLKNLGYI